MAGNLPKAGRFCDLTEHYQWLLYNLGLIKHLEPISKISFGPISLLFWPNLKPPVQSMLTWAFWPIFSKRPARYPSSTSKQIKRLRFPILPGRYQ